jgi:hypothetical protein
VKSQRIHACFYSLQIFLFLKELYTGNEQHLLSLIACPARSFIAYLIGD